MFCRSLFESSLKYFPPTVDSDLCNGDIFFFANCCLLQEPNSEKTNNGIHYKLQLLYSNGEFVFWKHVQKYTSGTSVCIKKKTRVEIFTAINAKCSNNLPVAPCKFYFIHWVQIFQIHKLFFSLFPRRQNRTGSLHSVNRFHDEAGKLLLHFSPPFSLFLQHGAPCALCTKQRVVEIVAPTATTKKKTQNPTIMMV